MLFHYRGIFYAANNPKIQKIGHMTNQIKLSAHGNCGVSHDTLISLNLVELHAGDNPKIKEIDHMTNI